MKLQGTMRINDRGHLEIGGCDTVELAERFGTPLYVLDEQYFRQNCRNYNRAFMEKYDGEVLYAAKTLLTLAICRIIAEEGLSLDVVSGGELYTAKKARFPMERVYFHGNNKSADELKLALEYKVGRIIVDNQYELLMLNKLAGEAGVHVKIMLRLTPGVEAHTHEYIKTGQIDSKFGIVIENGQAMEIIKQAMALENIQLTGLHCHIGSQIFEMESYTHAAEVMLGFTALVYQETGWQPEEMNFGGGLGIYYTSADEPQPVSKYADMLVPAVQTLAKSYGLITPRVLVEPGRSISGPAGTTLYTVGSVKEIPGIRTYVAVDGGMGDNPRPALYQSRYEALLANRADQQPEETVSIAGKCCESGDMLIWDINLPAPAPGDILAVSSTGAYNYSMSMNYNRLPRPAMVLVRDGAADIIIARETYDDLIRNDMVPERLGESKVVRMAGAN
ncbi:Diaminopimelate decarboxylase [Sporotomaculum syntrophicum]|uniref:Diaminopimelate decarboxylase n=1 Tax=Sporotomaculum syntrophicum TaxID=182264 RepID=A0A9D2WSW3_9FIRM|nr:diaminopimelate decarboxylase [Sporotomaculum syntrophicum]KAF1086493.1 Diaminopimelate decarboxylase [Sporotomaculum syntrophicum]